MNLILYAHKDALRKGTVLKRQIGRQVKNHEIQTIQTFNAFKVRLKQVSVYDKEIFVLLADSKQRLNELMLLTDWLENKRILLILPDDSKDIVSLAHQFFPRYFTYVNDTYADLCAVITKMSNNKENIKLI